MNRKANGCFIIILMVLLFACQCRSAFQNKASNTIDTCLVSPLKGYIPVIEGGPPIGTIPELITEKLVLPPRWIEMIPLELDQKLNVELLFVTNQDNLSLFWLYAEYEGNARIFLVNSSEVKEFLFPEPTKLINKKNEVYAISADPSTSQLSVQKYNRQTGRFETVVLETGVFAKEIYDVEIDKSLLFWFLVYEKDKTRSHQLFSYDLNRGESTIFELQDGWVQEIETDNEGNLFLLIYSGGNNEIYLEADDGLVWQGTYNTQVAAIIQDAVHLFISDNNQLWLSDALWFPRAGYTTDKRIIIRSPIFVREDVRYPIVWESPVPQVVSGDGRVWFRSKQGLTWFQPNTGQWCMFTTAQSNIVKDGEGNLWIFHDNALYMLPAEETARKPE